MLYDVTVPQFAKMLHNLDQFFDKAIAWGEVRKFDPDILLNTRLAPDQFPLVRQVQIACDTAKIGAARLTGKEAPVHADDETTLVQLRARIASVIGWLQSIGEADFAVDPEDRERVLTEDARPTVQASYDVLAGLASFDHASVEAALREALVEGLGLKPKLAFGPVRVAVTGRRISPPLFESIELLGKERTLARLQAALA